MKLTVITVNLNNRKGLVKTVESVLNQSFRDFEYIIVDGGSHDGSYEFIREIAEKHPGVVWTSERDKGVFNAMNKGIMKAKGEYLLFMNSGDYLVDRDVLASVFADEHSSDILLGAARVSESGKIVWTAFPKSNYSLNDLYHGSLAHQASFIKKSLFEQHGLYREDLKFMSDWAFFLKVLVLNGGSLESLDVLVSDYNAEGLSSDLKNRGAIEAEKAKVFSDFGLDRIVVDYKDWDNWMVQHKPILWAWNKDILRTIIMFLYRLRHV